MTVELSADQRALQARVREFAQAHVRKQAPETDQCEEYPWDTVEKMVEAGFFGMTVPTIYGGQGRSYLDAVLLIEEMAKECGVTARIAVEANMGAISAIMAYGSDEQKKLAADLVLAGDKPAICITEPAAGSAATEMTTRADKRGNGYVLNGAKHWITGAGVSRLHLIFAKVFDEAGEEQGIGGFIALRDETEGLRIGRREPTMGLRGIPEAEVFFEEMVVPPANLVLPPRGLKKGFADLMTAYNSQRVGAGTVAFGLALGGDERALAYANEREQCGRAIAEFQGLQWMLADMSIQLEASRGLIYRAAKSAEIDGALGFPDALLAAQAKVFASEMAIRVTNDALQVFGAKGYSRNTGIERIVRDARMFTIGGGTAQILRTMIASRILNRKLPQRRDGYAD